MKKFIYITDKIFRQEYCWVRAKSSSEFDELMKTKVPNYTELVEIEEDKEYDGETVSLSVDNVNVIFFWFNEKDATAIVHELLHAVFICMRERGITLTEDSEESFCYVLSFLYEEILKNIKKRT